MRRDRVHIQEMYVRVGDAIYQARHRELLSREELARKVGSTANHLQRVEEGVTACALHLLVAIADELDLTLDELVPVAIDEKELYA